MTDMVKISPEREQRLREFLQKHQLAIRDITMLERAFTHTSYAFEQQLPYDNERLEFLGDAVLGLVVSEYLYMRHPHDQEGALSKLKSLIISRNVLGKRAQDLGIGDLILLGKGEGLHGGRERPALLGSALEAVVGALYLDVGVDAIRPFLQREIFEPGRQLSATDEYGDYKSLLQEFVQKSSQTVPEYDIVRESGPDHNKHFEVEVRVNGEVLGRGEGSRKKSAENQAAMRAYWSMRNDPRYKDWIAPGAQRPASDQFPAQG